MSSERFASTCYPEREGVAVRRLIELLARLDDDDIVGAGITEHDASTSPAKPT